MLSTLYIWVMAAALFFSGNLVPMPPPLAHAIADMSEAYPLFGGDEGPKQTAALLTVFAWKESGYNNKLAGKEKVGYSHGAFMVGDCYPYSCQEVMNDEWKSTYVALRWMAMSMKYCNDPDYFLAIYASGRCENMAGRKISYERMMWMRKLIQMVK